MKVLYITNMYPTQKDPYYGIFVKEQIDDLKSLKRIDYDLIYINGKKNKLDYLKSILQIGYRLKFSHYDLIHIHYGLSGLFLLFGLKPKIPVILTLHGGDILIEQGRGIQVYLTKLICRKVDHIITLNAQMEKIIAELHSRYTRIPCGVNLSLFKQKEKQKQQEKYRIIFPSSKNRLVKNYALFKEVIILLQSQYKMNIQELNIENLSREQVAELLSTSDCLLMTSISEGSPQVIKEALACHLPIISTRVGDVQEILEGVEGCAIVDHFSSEDLAYKVYQILCTGQVPDGRKRIQQLELDTYSITSRLYTLYQSLVSN